MRRNSTHDWGPPLPGQGSAQVCRLCGVKNLPTAKDPHHPDATCQGAPQSAVAQVLADYDPY